MLKLLWRDWRSCLMLVRMAFWVASLSVLVKLFPLPQAFNMLAAKVKPAAPADPKEVQDKLASLIDRLLALDILVFTPTCWKRAAILHRYLALNGIDNRMIFGVRNAQEKLLEGHAWLEADNKPILEKINPQYTKVFVLP